MREQQPGRKFDVSPKPGQTRRSLRAGEARERWPQPWQVGLNVSRGEAEEDWPQPWQALSRSEKSCSERRGWEPVAKLATAASDEGM